MIWPPPGKPITYSEQAMTLSPAERNLTCCGRTLLAAPAPCDRIMTVTRHLFVPSSYRWRRVDGSEAGDLRCGAARTCPPAGATRHDDVILGAYRTLLLILVTMTVGVMLFCSTMKLITALFSCSMPEQPVVRYSPNATTIHSDGAARLSTVRGVDKG